MLQWFYFILEILKSFRLNPKKNILIIEDNIHEAENLQEYLALLKRRSDIARTAEEAKGLLLNKKYSIIFVDIRLPLMNGIDLIKFIKERYPNANNIIVVGEINDLYKFPYGTFVSIIIKPVTLESIKETLRILE